MEVDSINMNPTLDTISDMFDLRVQQVKSNTVPSWPWLDENGKKCMPTKHEDRTYEKYTQACACMIFMMELHRGEPSSFAKKDVKTVRNKSKELVSG